MLERFSQLDRSLILIIIVVGVIAFACLCGVTILLLTSSNQSPAQPARIALNSIVILGDTISCNRPTNIQITVANEGEAPSDTGIIALQDVDTVTGVITYSGSVEFPAIAPHSNYVATVSVLVTSYYDQTHRLTARTHDQLAEIRYVLQSGDCLTQPTPILPTQIIPVFPTIAITGRDFGPSECFLVLSQNKAVFDQPYQNLRGLLDPGAYNAARIEIVNNAEWFRLTTTTYGVVWIEGASLNKQGDCNLIDR
ncbi:MAG: hypothetical protein KC519_11520 [Anaerolineae bacterium]|nr:hypothetical protein [Anaerolineae bacterium]